MLNTSQKGAESHQPAAANMSAMMTAQTEQAITMAKASFEQVATKSREAMARTTAAAQTLAQAKTAPELMQLQSEFACAEFSTAIAQTTKLSQDMFKTMTAIFEPLQRQAVIAAQIKDVLHDS